MIEIYTALLLHEAKLSITEENIKKVLGSIGATIDEGKIKALVTSLEGQNIDELLKQASVTIPTPVEKKEEKKEEEEKKAEEAAVAGLGALFG